MLAPTLLLALAAWTSVPAEAQIPSPPASQVAAARLAHNGRPAALTPPPKHISLSLMQRGDRDLEMRAFLVEQGPVRLVEEIRVDLSPGQVHRRVGNQRGELPPYLRILSEADDFSNDPRLI